MFVSQAYLLAHRSYIRPVLYIFYPNNENVEVQNESYAYVIFLVLRQSLVSLQMNNAKFSLAQNRFRLRFISRISYLFRYSLCKLHHFKTGKNVHQKQYNKTIEKLHKIYNHYIKHLPCKHC